VLRSCKRLTRPGYFNLPDDDKAVAWNTNMTRDAGVSTLPMVPRPAEQREFQNLPVPYAGLNANGMGGPIWPYATSVTLTASGQSLNGPKPNAITRMTISILLKKTMPIRIGLKLDDGRVFPWIDRPESGHG